MTYTPAVDLSRWQGKVDFTKMRAAGIDRVWCRSHNGTTPDPNFAGYVRDAKSAGLNVGAYLFFRPAQDPVHQGQLLAAASRDLDLVPQYDLEVDDGMGLGAKDATRALIGTCDAILGKPGIVYTSAAWWHNVTGDMPGYSDHPLWAARYPAGSKTPPHPAAKWADYAMTLNQPAVAHGWDRWDLWQWSAGGNNAAQTYGASGSDLDLNIIRDDVLDRLLMPHAQPVPPPVSRPPAPGGNVTQGEAYDTITLTYGAMFGSLCGNVHPSVDPGRPIVTQTDLSDVLKLWHAVNPNLSDLIRRH